MNLRYDYLLLSAFLLQNAPVRGVAAVGRQQQQQHQVQPQRPQSPARKRQLQQQPQPQKISASSSKAKRKRIRDGVISHPVSLSRANLEGDLAEKASFVELQ